MTDILSKFAIKAATAKNAGFMVLGLGAALVTTAAMRADLRVQPVAVGHCPFGSVNKAHVGGLHITNVAVQNISAAVAKVA